MSEWNKILAGCGGSVSLLVSEAHVYFTFFLSLLYLLTYRRMSAVTGVRRRGSGGAVWRYRFFVRENRF